MSPKAVQYRTGSIIFFSGDRSDKIYILKSGIISLNYKDIETGQDIRDHIKTGEFFGVKSALGNFPRDETAVVVSDSLVIVFSVPEFEQMVLSNTRIIMKMLKVFSNQLRRIHKQVKNLLSAGNQDNPDEGLFNIGEYYMKNQMIPQAIYAFNRYLTYYPSGAQAVQATENIDLLERRQSRPGGGKSPALSGTASPQKQKKTASYYDCVSLISQGSYQEALKGFQRLIDEDADPEHLAKTEYEIGRCHFFLEDYDTSIARFTQLVKKYPKHPDLKEVLLYIGMAYEKKGNVQKAVGFFRKLETMAGPDEPITRKVKKALKRVGG